jgi:hypothetical protein
MALPVTREGEGLQAIPVHRPTAPTYDMLESYDASKKDGPAKLHVVTWFRGEDARELREKLARRKLEDITRDNLDYYARRFPKVRSLGPNQAKDDPVRDVITYTEDYEIDGFWEKGERQLDASVLRSYLPDPQATKRVLPLAVQDPVDVRTVTKVFVPARIPFKPDRGNDQTLVGRLDYDLHEEGQVFSLEYRYRSTASVVPADALPKLRKQLETLRNDLGFHLRLPEPKTTDDTAYEAGKAAGRLTAAVVMVLVGLFFVLGMIAVPIVLVVLLTRKKQPPPAPAVIASPVIEALPVSKPAERSEPPTGT